MRLTAQRCAVAAVALALGLSAGTAAAQPSNPLLASARLQGTFQLNGRLTVAAHVRGEHLGQAVSRNWSFSSFCPSGACPTVSLIRRRSGGTDTLTLQQRSPGYYVGHSSFYAPLQCSTTTYPAGERVPFTITVRVTGAYPRNGTAIASDITATYHNGYRINLTPCVGVLGHDAAVYRGRLIGPAKDTTTKPRRR